MLTSGTTYDILFTSQAGPKLILYVNGVSNAVNNLVNNSLPVWQSLSKAPSGPFNGLIREFLVWTNVTLTAADAVTLHTYRTNTYGP